MTRATVPDALRRAAVACVLGFAGGCASPPPDAKPTEPPDAPVAVAPTPPGAAPAGVPRAAVAPAAVPPAAKAEPPLLRPDRVVEILGELPAKPGDAAFADSPLPPPRGKTRAIREIPPLAGGPTTSAIPPWMVSFPATERQRVGMDEAELNAFLDDQVKTRLRGSPRWNEIWDRNLTLMTPAHTVAVPAFALSKFEVTNAQWERFLLDRTATLTTEGGETLEDLAVELWRYDREKEGGPIQAGWRYLLATNEAALLPVLNPTNDENWDPLVARAGAAKLPAGLALRHCRYPLPVHWRDGRLAAAERRRPVRSISLELCIDFCEWAGFHVPHEFEWERAARGDEGRWFPWGGEWDGTRAVWSGYYAAWLTAVEAAMKKGGKATVELLAKNPPEPVDVDSFPQGATPEGLHHMTGNVSEFVANRSVRYPGSRTGFKFAGMTQLARGGNFEDLAEVLLAADRNPESRQGALLGSHLVATNGLRLAAYPVAGADVAAAVALEWSDRQRFGSKGILQPVPAGIADEKKAAPYWGLALQNTAGYLVRSVVDADPDHVFVVGAAQGVAFLPVKGFPNETVKGIADVARFAADPDRPLFLGLLVGTSNVAFTVKTQQPGREPTEVNVSSRDPKFVAEPDGESRLYTRADVGLMLVLEGEEVAVYAADDAVRGRAMVRSSPLGHLAAPARVETDSGGAPPSGSIEGPAESRVAVLSARIPLLAKDGEPQKGAASIRVTIRVPVVPR